MKKLMSKSVLLGFVVLLATFFNATLYAKTANATLSKDEELALWSSALNEANGNQEYAKELFELKKGTIEDLKDSNPSYSAEESKNIEDVLNATLEKHKKENGGQGRTPEQNAELIEIIEKFYGSEKHDKAMGNYCEKSQELKDKYSQSPQ